MIAGAWIVVETRVPEPLVDMTMLRDRPVWTTNLSATLIGFGMFASFVLIPQFVEMPTSTGYGFGASVTEAGFFLLPLTVAMLLVGPVAGRLSVTVGSRVPLALGALLSTLGWVLLALAHSSSWQIYVVTFIMGLGIGLAFASMVNVIVESVRPDQTGVATGMNVIFRNVGGSLGAQISASILTASVVLGGLPTETSFVDAFWLSAATLRLGIRGCAAGAQAGHRAQRCPRRAGTGAGRGLTQAPAGRRASSRSVQASTLSTTRCVPLHGSRARVSRTSSADAASATCTTWNPSSSGPPRTRKPLSTSPSMNAACSSQPDCCSSGSDRS